MDRHLSEVRAAVARIARGGVGRGRRYPASVRAAVVEVAREQMAVGAKRASVARTIGVSGPTLASWLRGTARSAVGFRPVTIAREAGAGPAGLRSAASPGVLVMPSGIRVEGLGVPELVALLRALA